MTANGATVSNFLIHEFYVVYVQPHPGRDVLSGGGHAYALEPPAHVVSATTACHKSLKATIT